MDANRPSAGISDVCQVLSDHIRLFVCVYLDTTDETAYPVEELATAITEWDDSVGATSKSVDEMRIALHHQHLPALASHEIVEYDERTGMVHQRQSMREWEDAHFIDWDALAARVRSSVATENHEVERFK